MARDLLISASWQSENNVAIPNQYLDDFLWPQC